MQKTLSRLVQQQKASIDRACCVCLQYQLGRLGLSCDVPYGVTMLVLANNNLQGTLPQRASFWAPFSPSLLYLDMSGEHACSCLVPISFGACRRIVARASQRAAAEQHWDS